jgi:hypothetical protein
MGDEPVESVVAIDAESRLSRVAGYVRAHGLKTGLEVGVNFVLPFLIYGSARGALGDVPALMAAGTPPIAWSIAGFIRERKLDAISILVLGGIALSLLAFAGGGGVKVLQLRENLVSGLVGLVFLGSAAIGKPLIYQLARAGARRRAGGAVEAVEALRDDPIFRRTMVVATLVWGAGLLATCAVNCTLVFVLSIKSFMLISGPISYASIGALSAWSFWFVPRGKRLAEARRGQA